MDQKKIGELICELRKEKGFTQKRLAEKMNVSDRTISKWERGLGCPDVSLLHKLSAWLEVDLEKMLTGDLEPNSADGGNMKRIKFYVCPSCGNILTSTGEAGVSCCGRKMAPLIPMQADETHHISVEVLDDEYYITFSHEMSKNHYLNFIAYAGCDCLYIRRLYPEQGNEVRIPMLRGGTFYFGCSKDGLWKTVKKLK